MKKFAFDGSLDTLFKGSSFFDVYENAEFLCYEDNVGTILSKGYQLRQALKEVHPGKHVKMQGMWLTTCKSMPLLVKKTGPNVIVKHYEFTANRLTGLTAAYAFKNRFRYPKLLATEAVPLGIEWDSRDEIIARLYLATVSGSEHFYEQFSFWPLVCALKKLQLKKITLEPVLKMAKKKNDKGVRLLDDMVSNWKIACNLWLQFAESRTNLKKALRTFPKEIKTLFP